MPDIKVSDLHLKKELTQIRKAARVLRDPGTSSSWKSPLTSSRSAAIAAAAAVATGSASTSAVLRNQFSSEGLGKNGAARLGLAQFPARTENNENNVNGREKRVYLYNWKNLNQKSRNDGGGGGGGGDDDDGGEGRDRSSSWVQGSVDDSLSDARNGGDSRSDTYLGERSSASMIFRCRDANLVTLGTPSSKRVLRGKKKGRKNVSHLDVLSRQQQKEIVVGRKSVASRSLLSDRPMMNGVLPGDGFLEQSDDTEDYCNSEDLGKFSGASSLLLKLKQRNRSQSSSRFLKSSRKEDSSYSYSTPALSTSSYNRYLNNCPSTVGSWDATTGSLMDADDEVDDPLDLPGRRGCGIPCYWSKRTPRNRASCGKCYSPSLSDTLRRKGSSILCGSQSMYHKRRHSPSSNQRRIAGRSAQGLLPLLTSSDNGRGGSSIGTGFSDDELSTNFGELDLEALSRLDGRRWSASCRSQDGLEIVAHTAGDEESSPENIRSLSQKYRPMFFDELIGQSIVVQALTTSVTRGRVAPVYLFQGPRGTGKTSTARIFAAALNCLGTEDAKPCGYCRECTDFLSGKTAEFLEVDGTNKRGIDKIRYILKNLSMGLPSSSSRYRVFVIDECHLLPSKTWLGLLKFLEDPPLRVVFIFLTTDLDNVPRTVQSRCQKYLFNRIKDEDIIARLKKISASENLDVESDALELITLNADGSLRDAETMLDQLSLLGKRITTSLVNELVGVVPDEKLLELLELAMSSDTAETVKRARELMDSGVDPIFLMSQLASLITDVIAGTYRDADSKYSHLLFGGRNLTESELERLKYALKLLSEAEKQLRDSSERSTWFTATLLQLGSSPSPDLTRSGSSRRQSSKTTEDDPSSISTEAIVYRQNLGPHYMNLKPNSFLLQNKTYSRQGESVSQVDGYSSEANLSDNRIVNGDFLPASCHNSTNKNGIVSCKTSEGLDNIWANCIAKCHSKTLRQLLHAHGKLLSISEHEGVLVAYIAFGDGDVKSRAERFLSSITNSIEIVMRRNVEVRIIFLPDSISFSILNQAELSNGVPRAETSTVTRKERMTIPAVPGDGYSNLNFHEVSFKVPRGSLSDMEGKLRSVNDGSSLAVRSTTVAELHAEGSNTSEINGSTEGREEVPMQRIESIIREQRLETAWLQAAEKGTPGSLSNLKPEKNQILPQEACRPSNLASIKSSAFSSQEWEDELDHELNILKLNDGKSLQKGQISRRHDSHPVSPSLLHDGNISKESLGYESGSRTGGCSGLFCWNNTRLSKRGKVKAKPARSRRRPFLLFGECGQSKKSDSRNRN